MSWLAYLCPYVRRLQAKLRAADLDAMFYLKLSQDRASALAERGEELALTRKARDEQTRQVLEARASYTKLEEKWLACLNDLIAARDAREVVHADLVSATDASARFRAMWEENAERAAKAERVAAFYRCAFGNVRRAVDNAVNDQPSLASPVAPTAPRPLHANAYDELCVAIGT